MNPFYPTACCTNDFSLFLDINNNIWIIGNTKSSNDISFDNIQESRKLSKINNLKDILYVSCGEFHCICNDINGTVWGFGINNLKCLLSLPNYVETNKPQQLQDLPFIINVRCGKQFSICIDENYNIWGFGDNSSFQLGPIDNNDKRIITKIDNLKDCSCSAGSIIFLTHDGDVYGIGNISNKHLIFKALPEDKTLSKISLPFISKIACGWYHTLALSDTGDLYSFGRNELNELGLKDCFTEGTPTKISDIPEIIDISCGYRHSLCIDINNKLWLFGWNRHGQLGIKIQERVLPFCSNIPEQITQLSIGGNHTLIKDINNNIWGTGRNDKQQYGKYINNNQKKTNFIKLSIYDEITIYYKKNRQKSARK